MPTFTATGFASASGGANAFVPLPQRTAARGHAFGDGQVRFRAAAPLGAFDDFAIFGLDEVDPAVSYVSNGTTMTVAQGETWKRHHLTATAPAEYRHSQGVAWRRAAYAAVGFDFGNVVPNNAVIMNHVQVEASPLQYSGPADYEVPRQSSITVRPDRLNYVANPSFEVDSSRWAGLEANLTLDVNRVWRGTKALRVAAQDPGTGTRQGVRYALGALTPNVTHCFSAYVSPGTFCPDIQIRAGTGTVIAQPYSGSNPESADLRWRRIWCRFVPARTSASIYIYFDRTAKVAGGVNEFYVDAALCEEGSLPQPYFDGDSGYDYLWETGGLPQLSRSYFYQNRRMRGFLLRSAVSENTPLGVAAKASFGDFALRKPIYGGGSYRVAYEDTY